VNVSANERNDAMKIGELLQNLRQRLVTCRQDDTLETVAKAMHTHAIGAMPVCETGNRIIGIVSERDLVRTLATTNWGELNYVRIRDVMTQQPKSCSINDDIHDAEQLMRKFNFRHVPVLEGDRVIGMLSIRDTQALRLRESANEINLLRDAVVAARYR
jgi:CBS domain-containing protein